MRDDADGQVALASYPRSGSTWLRHMLEQVTGRPSGSIYNEGFLPAGREGIVVKTHRPMSDGFSRAVHLVRDPFDAISSHFHFMREHRGQEVDWVEFAPQQGRRWTRHANFWIGCDLERLLVRYEDMRAEPAAEVSRVVQWLGFDISEGDVRTVADASTTTRMRALYPRAGSTFFREGLVGTGIDDFHEEQVARLLERAAPAMRQLGYLRSADI